MKIFRVSVPWKQGFHMRPASRLVKYANSCKSSIKLKAHDSIADARSIMSLLLLCATVGTVLEVEISGIDEGAAANVVAGLFEHDNESEANPVEPETIDPRNVP